MDEETIRKLWPRCKELLDDRHPAFAFYLAHSRVQLANDRLLVHVLTPLARAWLDQFLRAMVEEAVTRVTGRQLQVVFLCES